MNKISSLKQHQEQVNESYVNLLPPHEEEKRKHADDVWGMLQKAYAQIGGIAGSGFKDKEDMIKNIPFWKIGKTKGKTNSVVLYKDKGGRKRVAIATDGSEEGKARLANMLKADYDRSYGEISGPSLKFLKRHTSDGFVKKTAIKFDDVDKISRANGDEIKPVDHRDPEVVAHPELKDFFYQRKIGNEYHTKIMLGTPNKKITY